jgi:hypothetical protein
MVPSADEIDDMFVRDFIHVAQPFELVAPHFIADADWLNRLAEDAALHARELSEALQLPPDHRRAHDADHEADEPVHCESGAVRVRNDSLIVPMVITGAPATGCRRSRPTSRSRRSGRRCPS